MKFKWPLGQDVRWIVAHSEHSFTPIFVYHSVDNDNSRLSKHLTASWIRFTFNALWGLFEIFYLPLIHIYVKHIWQYKNYSYCRVVFRIFIKRLIGIDGDGAGVDTVVDLTGRGIWPKYSRICRLVAVAVLVYFIPLIHLSSHWNWFEKQDQEELNN